MNAKSRDQNSVDSASQREALKQSEKKAAQQQPETFKDGETESKKVEVGPDMTDAPIKGIDPDKPKRGAG